MVDLAETIEFKEKPKQAGTVTWIQEHFCFLGLQYIKHLQGELTNECEVILKAELTIYGEDGYTTDDISEYMYGILYDLPHAKGLKIKSTYYGPSVAPWFSSEVKDEFHETVSSFGTIESFTYTLHEFLYNHGAGWCARYENGNRFRFQKALRHPRIPS